MNPRAQRANKQREGSGPAQVDPNIAHRLAAAILLGTVTSDRPEVLQYAMELADETQPPHIAEATKQIVADVRRYDEGTAGGLEAALAAADRVRAPSGLTDKELRAAVDALEAALDVSDYAEGPFPAWESALVKLRAFLASGDADG